MFVARMAEFARITLRETPYGGAIEAEAHLSPKDLMHARNALILFIHGYNVGEAEALIAYGGMHRQLGVPWSGLTAGLLWPGDGAASAPGQIQTWTSRFLRPLTYPHQPARAAQAAEILMEAIRTAVEDRQNSANAARRDVLPLDLHIVAHSMGCRLALELIRLLQARLGTALRLRLLVLMAAAVPLYLIQEGRPLAKALRQADRLRNYRSRKDKVLKWAFRTGQMLERPFPYGWGFSSRGALGRLGSGGSIEDIETDHGHSGYWSDGRIAQDLVRDLAELQPDLISSARRLTWPFRKKRGEEARRPIRGRQVARRTGR